MKLVLRLPSGRSRPCEGCGLLLYDEVAIKVWADTALGSTGDPAATVRPVIVLGCLYTGRVRV